MINLIDYYVIRIGILNTDELINSQKNEFIHSSHYVNLFYIFKVKDIKLRSHGGIRQVGTQLQGQHHDEHHLNKQGQEDQVSRRHMPQSKQ